MDNKTSNSTEASASAGKAGANATSSLNSTENATALFNARDFTANPNATLSQSVSKQPMNTDYQGIDMGMAGLKTAGGLFLILGFLLLTLWLIKRFNLRTKLGLGGEKELTYVTRMNLGQGKSIAVVRFLNRYLVLGITNSSINLLTEMDDRHAQESPPESKFAKTMEQSAQDAPADVPDNLPNPVT